MKRLFVILLALSFVLIGGIASAQYDWPDSENVRDIGGYYGSVGITPPTEIIRVRYGLQNDLLQSGYSHGDLISGDVVVWDTNSATSLGYSISACIASNDGSYAGVLVTNIETADDNATTIRSSGRNVGFMAIRGYCLANMTFANPTSNAGDRLITAGACEGVTTPRAKFMTAVDGNVAYVDTANNVFNSNSQDVGVLLAAPTGVGEADSNLAPVWLR